MRLSIIIPLFNNLEYITKSIDSCYDISLNNNDYEIIIINDGSYNFTLKELTNKLSGYSNLIILDQPNSGVSFSRNKGLEICRGKYILFLDSDDYLNHRLINSLLLYAEENSLDFLITSHSNSVEPVSNSSHDSNYSKICSGISLLNSGYWQGSSCGVFFSSNFLKYNNLRFIDGVINGEDNIFMSLAFHYAKSVSITNSEFYFVNHFENSASRNWNFNKLIKLLDASKKSKNEFTLRGIINAISYKKLQYSLLSNALYHYSKLNLTNSQKNIFHMKYNEIKKDSILYYGSIKDILKSFLVKNLPLLVASYFKFNQKIN